MVFVQVKDTFYSKIHCYQCNKKKMCLYHLLTINDINKFHQLIEKNNLIKKHHLIFKYGDKFKYLYVIRTGSLKIYSITADGEELIYGFKMSGNLIGFDAIKYKKHLTFCETLENSRICFIPYNNIKFLNYIPLRKHIINLFSKEISRTYNLILLLSKKDAKKKLSFFLYNMSKRFYTRGFSKYEFRLSMTRKEMGNYLGLTVETISRIFLKLQRFGIINVIGKHIQINSLKLLKELIHPIYCF